MDNREIAIGHWFVHRDFRRHDGSVRVRLLRVMSIGKAFATCWVEGNRDRRRILVGVLKDVRSKDFIGPFASEQSAQKLKGKLEKIYECAAQAAENAIGGA